MAWTLPEVPLGKYGRFESMHSSLGHVVHTWTPRVTKVDPAYLDCSVYLYPSEGDAWAGQDAGGSGFLVSMPSEVHAERVHIYAVTAKHVVQDDNKKPRAQVLRLTTLDRKSDVLDLTDRWVPSKSDDLVIAPLRARELDPYRYDPVPVERFVTEDDLYAHFPHVYIGTPCFMVAWRITSQLTAVACAVFISLSPTVEWHNHTGENRGSAASHSGEAIIAEFSLHLTAEPGTRMLLPMLL